MNANNLAIEIERMSNDLGMKISNYSRSIGNTSFTVGTELEAYKAAYEYRWTKMVAVKKEAPDSWLVQIYT